MSDLLLECTSEYRVRYAEVDQMKFMYYGRYLEYFEIARCEMLRVIGLPYAEIEKRGLLLPVLESHVTYKRPAYYDDLIAVKASMKGMPQVKLRIEYEVHNKETGVLLATGYTEHAFLNPETNKVTRVPQIFTEAVNEYFKTV
jgi:acyl-CoA thioester hydrolase